MIERNVGVPSVLAVAIGLALAGCGGGSSTANNNDNNTTKINKNFNRVSYYPVCKQLDPDCNIDDETVAEISAVSNDGLTLVYTDGPNNQLGFVDITDATNPAGLGTVKLAGEPTSVAIAGDVVLVGVNTSPDFVNVSGELTVIDLATRAILSSHDLGGQPDSIAVSPDGKYVAVVIENERDEDLGDGVPPQLPAGELLILEIANLATTLRSVDLTGLATLFPGDPEPEYVDINEDNLAVVTLQENNHIILVDLADGRIVNHFSAGSVDLEQIDKTEEDPALISLTESLTAVPREPDGVSWISTTHFATANEGDLNGGSRGFSIFDTSGNVVFDSGNTLDHETVRLGHYPDDRSKNKGNEPENVDFAAFGDKKYLFVNSERASVVFVYDVADIEKPVLKQVLPAGTGPEGVLTIPSRDLMIASSEVDDRGDKMRGGLNIYQYAESSINYPTIESSDRTDGTPIPWSALSGLATDPATGTVYTIHDSFYQQSRIFTLDVDQKPAKITAETLITDANDIFASIPTTVLADNSVADDDPGRIAVFDDADLANLINIDKTVNLDPEGITVASDGGFWIASEGSGTVGDAGRPVNSLDFLIKTDNTGVIEEVVTLPAAVNAIQVRFGFEGVAEYDNKVYVAFQRAWGVESNPRIGIYDIASKSWSFVFYPLEAPISQNGGWVGLSELTSLGNGEFMVIERDNQGGPDAAIKRLYKFNIGGVAAGATVSKTLVRDLMDDLAVPNGSTLEKIEGATVLSDGVVLVVNDNDGVDDSNGETQLLNLGNILN